MNILWKLILFSYFSPNYHIAKKKIPGLENFSEGNMYHYSIYEILHVILMIVFIAMKTKPVPGNIRVPTSAWSGYGLSHSSPASELEHRKKESFSASLLDVMNKKTSLKVVLTSPFPTLNSEWYYFHNTCVISGFLHGMNEISDIVGPEERRFHS